MRPVGAGGYAGDADERAEQVEGLEVLADIAALNRAFHQRINRAADLGFGSFVELRRAAGIGVQRRGDDVLGLDVVDEQLHPGAQGFQGRQTLGELPFRRGQLFYFGAIDRFDQRVAGRKMAIQSSRAHPRFFGNVVQAGAGAVAGEGLLGHFQHARAVALSVGARFAVGGFGPFGVYDRFWVFGGHRLLGLEKIVATGDRLR